MSDIPFWIHVSTALLTPMIAIVGLGLGVYNYRLSRRRRRDELFDRRYEFYRRFRSMWLNTGTGAPAGQYPSLDAEDL